MASYVTQLSFFFLILIVSSVQIEARIGLFFSKFIHTSKNVAHPTITLDLASSPAPAQGPVSQSPEVAPIVSPLAPEPEPFFYESQNAYGLYGEESNPSPTADEDEYKAQANELVNEKVENGYGKTNLYSNYKYPSKYNNYEYPTNYYNNNGYRSSNNDNNNRYTESYNAEGYVTERQGMSDTRYLENGKYYHNSRNENTDFNGYDSRGNVRNEEYYGSNNEHPNEYNTMEEYENEENEKRHVYVP